MKNQPQRSCAQIWRTVVFAGAMLGTGACGGKKAATTTPETPTPTETAPGDGTSTETAAPTGPTSDPTTPTEPTPTADPCAGNEPAKPDPRPRTPPDPRPQGRGFILA